MKFFQALMLDKIVFNLNYTAVMPEYLIDGSGVNESMLLRKFQGITQTLDIQHIAVRPDHIVEDGLRCFYKGNFDVSVQVEVELIGPDL